MPTSTLDYFKGEWEIEYCNDTGPNDDFFVEWYEVANGKMSFKCDDGKSAEYLIDLIRLSGANE